VVTAVAVCGLGQRVGSGGEQGAEAADVRDAEEEEEEEAAADALPHADVTDIQLLAKASLRRSIAWRSRIRKQRETSGL
jgi:hypothetical protein